MDRPTRHPLSVSVFFPFYNEEANVERTTLEALRAFRRITEDFEIILVDDGSDDATGAIADRLAATYRDVRAVHNPINLGYGGALCRGFREAKKTWVFYSDGDGQFDLADITRLLSLLDSCDIVSAFRCPRRDSAARRLMGRVWTTLLNLVFGLRLRDIDCAFKIYPRALFDRIELRSRSALIDVEILAAARQLGLTIGQVGVTHLPRRAGRPTGASPMAVIHALRELLRLHRRIARGPASRHGHGNGEKNSKGGSTS